MTCKLCGDEFVDGDTVLLGIHMAHIEDLVTGAVKEKQRKDKAKKEEAPEETPEEEPAKTEEEQPVEVDKQEMY